MTWRELLAAEQDKLVLPWLGGRVLRLGSRAFRLDGPTPWDIGWYSFTLRARRATVFGPAPANTEALERDVRGYLVGDRIVADGAYVSPLPATIAAFSETVHLLDPGLPRFARVVAGRICHGGELVYKSIDFGLGVEDAVLQAYYDRRPTLDGVKDVPPALDAAFRMESWQRQEAERRRAALEAQRAEEQARLEAEERRRDLAERLGTGQGRRAMAAVDFAQAARAALALGEAQYLDHRPGYEPGEMVVTFRMSHRQFVCSCDRATLRIIDAGICLTHHLTGEKGDTRFTLESLPAVIATAMRDGVLVVTRHTGEEDDGE